MSDYSHQKSYKNADIFSNLFIQTSNIRRKKIFYYLPKVNQMSNSPNESNNSRQVFLGPAGLRIRFRLRNVDDLTSPPSPPVVPIGRGRRDLRLNDVSNSSLTARGVGRGQRISSPSNQPGRTTLNVSEPIIVSPEGFGIMVQMNNHPADDSTSTNNSTDDLTSPSNNAVDDSTSNPVNLSQRIFAKRNTSSTSAVGRGVGQGQNISRPSNQTTSASIGREVRRGVGRAGRYSSPYQRPTRSGEETEEENYFPAPNDYERSNDGRLASFIVDLIDVEGGSPYDLFNRYAEYVLPQRIQTLERERERLRAQYQRLLCRLRQE